MRVYSLYADLARKSANPATRTSPRETGERLAAIQANPEGRWIFRLGSSCSRTRAATSEFRKIAAGFWSGNRASACPRDRNRLTRRPDTTPPIAPDRLASAWIAIDIGLALQHFVDPDAAPLELYPELCDTLFTPLVPTPSGRTTKNTRKQVTPHNNRRWP